MGLEGHPPCYHFHRLQMPRSIYESAWIAVVQLLGTCGGEFGFDSSLKFQTFIQLSCLRFFQLLTLKKHVLFLQFLFSPEQRDPSVLSILTPFACILMK